MALAGASGFLSQQILSQGLETCEKVRKTHRWGRRSAPTHTPSAAAALLTLILMTFLRRNNAIRCVFCDWSHLRYRRQQRQICHYLHERDRGFVIIEHAWLVITSLYWKINAARRREEARPSEETQIIIWRLQRRFFLAALLSQAFICQRLLTENLPYQHK